ncbi:MULTISPECIES: class I SAM-dependent methyltransferase [Acidiphilium]|uniref:Methyltransferase domain-containing protein n=1 Tax=Acidiphilium rubrum TaxID=526 RepID=A0A8G2CNF1_ACIRU|nr:MULTISPECIES: class I SAM-dependent methyltransferase [Acidiphilium]SIR43011.1 Methyltransferase domain-containing protein [Acidiphilium rubrum]
MEPLNELIARHYTRGDLGAALLAALGERAALPPAALMELLGAVDEFHVGGRAATIALAEDLALQPGQNVLDIGCGLGGTARLLATRHGVRVTGIDLTAEYVDVGNSLNARLGLSGQIDLVCGSALTLPFAARSFDAATMLHVGMNIADKVALFVQIASMLKPGGQIAIYDIMRTGGGALTFPLPWAGDASLSFVAAPLDYRRALTKAGFVVRGQINERERACAFFAEMAARAGPAPALGLGMLMGAEAAQKLAHIRTQIEAGLLAPIQILANIP